MWVIHHFRVLPTEDRFKQLSDRTKLLLLYGWLNHPKSEDRHAAYVKQMQDGQTKFTDEHAQALREQGMGDEQLAFIQEQLREAGLTE